MAQQGFFPTSFAATRNWTHVSSVAPLWGTLIQDVLPTELPRPRQLFHNTYIRWWQPNCLKDHDHGNEASLWDPGCPDGGCRGCDADGRDVADGKLVAANLGTFEEKLVWKPYFRVVLEVAQPRESTYLLEADWAIGPPLPQNQHQLWALYICIALFVLTIEDD